MRKMISKEDLIRAWNAYPKYDFEYLSREGNAPILQCLIDELFPNQEKITIWMNKKSGVIYEMHGFPKNENLYLFSDFIGFL